MDIKSYRYSTFRPILKFNKAIGELIIVTLITLTMKLIKPDQLKLVRLILATK